MNTRRGSVAVSSVTGIALVTATAAALLSVGLDQARDIESVRRETDAMYLAQAGVLEPAPSRYAIPDIAAANYAEEHDFDVAAMFAADGVWQHNDAGGSAHQLHSDSPGHIFRLNPTDREAQHASTEKDDFFLEDPYEAFGVQEQPDGPLIYPITLGTQDARSRVGGSESVYFIDGNLWLYNRRTSSLRFERGSQENVRVTFVVEGNIYVVDSLILQNMQRDGVTFVAIADDELEDSGNIHLGLPGLGRPDRVQAFMYAEKEFYVDGTPRSGKLDADEEKRESRDWGGETERGAGPDRDPQLIF